MESDKLPPDRIYEDTSWISKAGCKGLTHLFFPPPGENPLARDIREALAKTICDSCAVIVPCRNFAYTNKEAGFWAGENEEDRNTNLRMMGRAKK